MLSVKDGIVRACVIVIFAHLVRLIICLTLLRTGVDLVSPLGASVLNSSHFHRLDNLCRREMCEDECVDGLCRSRFCV